MSIAIIDFGMGNLRSIQYKLERARIDSIITHDIKSIMAAEKIILPGVGHFATAMRNLHSLGLVDVLNKKVIEEKTPIFGICLGVQLFTRFSEEGNVKGFGWVEADTRKFCSSRNGKTFKIPNIGWHKIKVCNNCKYLEGAEQNRYYFVHSYHICCDHVDDIAATAFYGTYFTAAILKENIFGTQFHPEKSHRIGFNILLKWAST